jgi:hypothetical protein
MTVVIAMIVAMTVSGVEIAIATVVAVTVTEIAMTAVDAIAKSSSQKMMSCFQLEAC